MIDVLVSRNMKTGEVTVHQVFEWEDYPDGKTRRKAIVKMSEAVDRNFPAPPWDTQVLTGPDLESVYNAYPLFSPGNNQ